MRRDPQLIQLSREHHAALRLAKQLLEVQSPPAADALAAVARESAGLLSHFEQEERELLPQLLNYGEAQLAARLQDEHRQMRALLQADDAASLKLLGVLLGGQIFFMLRSLRGMKGNMLRVNQYRFRNTKNHLGKVTSPRLKT